MALAGAAMFGFGPMSVKHLHRIVDLHDFASSLRTTTVFFLSVYGVILLLSLTRHGLRLSIPKLWSALSRGTRFYLCGVAAANAISGWCFFAMLEKLDPLSASLIMALAVIVNFFLARVILGEDTSLGSQLGRRKWISFLLIFSGVLTTSLYSYFSTAGNALERVTVGIIITGVASSVFGAVRSICVKKTINDYKAAHPEEEASALLPLAVARFSYLFAFLFTLVIGAFTALVDPALPFALPNIVLLHPFILVLGLVYGLAWSFNHIAMSHLEVSKLVLIPPVSSVFTVVYMTLGVLLLSLGTLPSWIQLPAAALVIGGSYLSATARA